MPYLTTIRWVCSIIQVATQLASQSEVKEVSLSEWISVKAAAEYTGYTTSHVRYLLRNGLVKGQRFGRDWFTTKEALDKYLATNPRPGPEPKSET